MNEIANICNRVGANVDLVRRGIGSDSRIGSKFLFAGLGYGGSCFPKDVKAVVRTAEDCGYEFQILKAVEAVNEKQKSIPFEQALAHFGGKLKGKHFAIWGLAFKPNTDDMREAPSLVVIERLLASGATVRVYDPEAMHEARKRHLGDRVQYAQNPMDALGGADALVLVTEWNEFRRPDFEQMKQLMRGHVIFDGRNIYPRKTLEDLGFRYHAIGT
jgi:UDPglucose 6-dehydrogenase